MSITLYRRRQLYYESKGAGWRVLSLLSVCLLSLLDLQYGFLLRLVGLQSAPTLGLLLLLLETVVFTAAVTSLVLLGWRAVSPLYSAPLQLTERQYRLLRLEPDTPGFVRSPGQEEKKYPNPFTPIKGSFISSPKPAPPSPSQSTTPVNTSYNSWLSSSGTSPAVLSPASNTSLSSLNSSNLRRDHYSGYDSPITDELQLSEYLTDYSAWESSYLSDRLDDSGSVASQSLVWRSGGRGPEPPQYRSTVYQLSSPPTKTASSNHDSPADKAQTEILSQRLGVDPMKLVTWNENLRIWMTQTILRPLVAEIETVNTALPKNGISDCKIGESPLDR